MFDEDTLKAGTELGEFIDASEHAGLLALSEQSRAEIVHALHEAGVGQPIEVRYDVLHLHALHHAVDGRLIFLGHPIALHFYECY